MLLSVLNSLCFCIGYAAIACMDFGDTVNWFLRLPLIPCTGTKTPCFLRLAIQRQTVSIVKSVMSAVSLRGGSARLSVFSVALL